MYCNKLPFLSSLALASALSFVGCGGNEPMVVDEDSLGVTPQALNSASSPIGTTCRAGPIAAFRFTGRATTYFTLADGTRFFEYEYLCGNGTTDVCGPVTLTPFRPATAWDAHVVVSPYPIISNAAGCW